MTVSGTGLSAALLYESLPALDATRVLDSTNATLAPFGMRFDLASADGGGLITFANDVLRISIRRQTSGLPASRLTGALSASFTRARPGDYVSPVAAHRAALIVDIADIRADPAEPMPEDTLIVVGFSALAAIAARSMPLMVHWQQTDMVYLPHELPSLRGIGFPVSLATRPEVRASRPDTRGNPRHAVVATQSERYFGKPVRIEPTTHPLPECLALIDFCIIKKLMGEDLLQRDGILHLPGQIEAAVRHVAASAQFPLGAICLTLRGTMPPVQPEAPTTRPYLAEPAQVTNVIRLNPKGRRLT